MTSQTFNNRILAIVLFLMATVSINAQQTAPMRALIGQSLSKMQQSDPQSVLNAIAELKRIDAMFPDSIQPKYQIALQNMVRIVQNPAQNGQRYYLSVMENFDKALKINPDNALAQQLQQKFQEGMKQAMQAP